MPTELQFVLNTVVLAVFGVLLFRWLFRRNSRNLFVLVLVGMVRGRDDRVSRPASPSAA